jgi:hypothetical protein
MNIVTKLEKYITKYATLAEDYYVLPLALWAMCTHTFPTFDTFPYLVITSYTKRSGKTRLMELVSMVSANGRTFSPDSPSSMFRALSEEAPSMFLDEAEKLNIENHPAREFLNKGYRQGQTITRVIGNKVIDMECFCPKCFVLIGDVYDTLGDRSMIVTMRRRTPIEAAHEVKFRFDVVRGEAGQLRAEMHSLIEEKQGDIAAEYAKGITLDFMNDRDEEIWQSIFTMAKVMCPERLTELTRCAADMSTEKSGPKRKSTGAEWEAAERKADDEEARVLLLRDLLTAIGKKKMIPSAEAVEALKDIPTGQWRKFRGKGLTTIDMGNLLDSLNVHPKVIRLISRQKAAKTGDKSTVRGYKREDLISAAKLAGLMK